MKRFLLRYTVCLLRGHSPTTRMPFFKAWYGNDERGTVHCSRCHRMMGEYRVFDVNGGAQ